jgi:hypothetical protein
MHISDDIDTLDDEVCHDSGWYTMTWRNKWLTAEAKSIEDMIAALRAAADELDEMRKAGVRLIDDGGVVHDYAELETTDPEVAQRFGLEAVEDDDIDDDIEDDFDEVV